MVEASPSEENTNYDYTRTLGLLYLPEGGGAYAFADRSERGLLTSLLDRFYKYVYILEEIEAFDAEYPQITGEFHFFSYDDEKTLYLGDHWIGDGIRLVNLSPEDFQYINGVKDSFKMYSEPGEYKYGFKDRRRKEFESELDHRRKLRIQGFEIEKKYEEIIEKEEKAALRESTIDAFNKAEKDSIEHQTIDPAEVDLGLEGGENSVQDNIEVSTLSVKSNEEISIKRARNKSESVGVGVGVGGWRYFLLFGLLPLFFIVYRKVYNRKP